MPLKCSSKAFLCLALTLLSWNPAIAQVDVWRPLGGPDGGTITAFAELSSGVLLAITDYALLRSTDDGRTWVNDSGFLNASLPSNMTQQIVYDLLRTRDGTVFLFGQLQAYTTRDGYSWTPIPKDPVNPSYPVPLTNAVETASGAILGTSGSSIFRSTDRGLNWTKLTTADGAGTLYVSGTTVWATAMDQHVLRKSTDDGSTWQDVMQTGGRGNIFHVFPSGRLLKDNGGSLHTSDDGGVTWTNFQSSQIWYCVLTLADGRVLVGNGSGGAVTADGGTTFGAWRIDLLPSLRPMRALHQTASGAILSANDTYGIVRSTDNAVTWQASTTPVASVRTLFPLHDGTLLAGTDAGIYRWNGASWSWTSRLATYTYAFAVDGTVILSASGPRPYVSVDGGATWTANAGTGFQGDLADVAVGSDGNWYILKTNGRMYRSTNKGGAWTSQNKPDGHDINEIVADASGGIIAATGNGVWRTADGGATWTRIDTIPTLDPLFAAAPTISLNHIVRTAAGALLTASGPYLFRSPDGGATWTFVRAPMSFRGYTLTASGDIWIANDRGLYRSRDAGATFEAVSTGIPVPVRGEAFIESALGTLYALTNGQGAYYLGTSGVATEPSEIPRVTALIEAWPNPFSASVEVRFTAPAGSARVEVFDVLGRRVATAFDGPVAAGETTVPLDGSTWQAGSYFVRIRTGSGVVTRPIVKAAR